MVEIKLDPPEVIDDPLLAIKSCIVHVKVLHKTIAKCKVYKKYTKIIPLTALTFSL